MTFLKSYPRSLARAAGPGLGLLLLTFAAAAGSLPACSAAFPGAAEAIELNRGAIQAFMRCTSAPGISVSVAIHGRIVWSEAFGYADLENEVPVTPRTRFRLGSVSKILTAAAVAKLHQEGKLDLDLPVHHYVPGFPEKGAPITSRQLAGHIGGIRHYQTKDYDNGRNIDFEHYETILDSLRIFQDDPLVAAPGTRYFYSTFGYTLLSQIVESASGQKFLAYMDANVFQPTGMRDTAPDYQDRITRGRTRFYMRGSDGQIVNAPYVDSSYKWAAGGLLSTADDLVRFGTAHLQPGFLTAETLQVMFTSLRTSDGKETGVGIGWRIGKDEQGRRVFHHAGSIHGGRTILMIYPDSGLVLAFLCNLSVTPAAVERTAQTLAETFLDSPEPGARSQSGFNLAGRYDYVVETGDSSSTGVIEITRAGASYSGNITAPKFLLELTRKMGQEPAERLAIAGVTADEKGATAIVVSPIGIFPLRMQFEGDKMTGLVKAPLGPPALEMVLKGTKR